MAGTPLILPEGARTPVPLSKHRRARSDLDFGAAAAAIQARTSSSGAVLQRALHRKATKTHEEKKELLGTLLGNVDALVEGVRQQGIWGLG